MIGIFITARMGSQRLPNKHLIKAGDKKFIEWTIARLLYEFEKEIQSSKIRLFIVTPTAPENYRFEEILRINYPYLSFYYGSDANIPLRHWQCARANSIDAIVNVDGDDVLCSMKAVRQVVEILMRDKMKFVKTTGLPLGMNCIGYSTDMLEACLQKFKDKEKLETGWGKIFEGQPVCNLPLGAIDHPELRFTLDYTEDSEFFQIIVGEFGERIISVSDTELIHFVLDNQVYLVNHFLNTGYWQNFNRQRETE